MGASLKIWLADLSYNTITKSVDAFPLGIGTLATYAQAHLKAEMPPEIELFNDPFELREALEKDAPDVLGFSNFMWNFRLSLEFARYAKSLHAEIITVMGGPNFPLDIPSQDRLVREDLNDIDVYVVGNTYEGEVAFLECLQRLEDADGDPAALDAPIPGCLRLGRASGRILRGGPVPRIRNLDDIPSPYQAGLMDKFFKTGLFAKIQLVRGCPFGCTFCNSAVKSNNKAYRYSFDRVKADLDYIVDRIDHSTALALADDNFGMYREDEDVADYLGTLIDAHDWPRMLRTTTGKNNPERVLRVQQKVRGRMSMTASVQSLDPGVLKTIDRSNIRLDVYETIQKKTHEAGHQSYADVITFLPGETAETMAQGVEKLLDMGVQAISASQLLLLPGSILATPGERERHGFETRFRLVANCIGDFGTGRIVAETEEVTYQTRTFSFDEYIEFRRFHLLIQVFWAERMFQEAFALAGQYGVGPRALIDTFQRHFSSAPQDFQENINAYLQGSVNELHASPEEALEFGQKHIDDLITGEVGGNILYIAMVRARLNILSSTLKFLEHGLRAALKGSGPHVEDEIDAVMAYYRAICIGSPLRSTLFETPVFENTMNVTKWRDENYQNSLSNYRYDAPVHLRTEVPEDLRETITSRLSAFGENPAALARLVRSWFADTFRRRVV